MATNNYWMKLWFDILRDPKMGMLPDRLWRRVIELFLLAGQQGEEGLLPNPAEIAWQLNKSEKAIITDLEKIRKTGIVDINVDGVWYVTNFQKRNAPVSSSKRAKDYRMRNYGTEFTGKSNADDEKTERKPNVNETLRSEEEQKNRRTEEQIKDTTTGTTFSDVAKAYEDVCGVLNSVTADKLKLAYSEYEPSWIMDALKETAVQNKRSWAYTEAILKRWQKEGRNKGKRAVKPERSADEFRQYRKAAQ